jgi:L-malate glycosyltransferase
MDRQLNVCHIISGDLWAGAEVQAFSLIKELSKISFVNLNVITFNNGILSSKVLDSGIQLTVIEERYTNLFAMIWRIYNVVKERMIDIFHVHGFKENLIGGIVAKILSSRVVRTHHGKGMIEGSLLHYFIEKINEKFLTNQLISVSQDLKHFLLSKNFQKSKIAVVRNSIDIKKIPSVENSIEVKTKLQIRDDVSVIGTIGRLVTVKGHKYLLEAARDIISKNNRVVFVFVGSGPLLDELKEFTASLGIEDYVRFTGFSDDPFPLLNIFDIFVLTSLYEGIPMALLEAMSMGKPIISTCVGGIPEIIKDGHNGLLVPPRDPKELSDACLKLLNEPQLSVTLASNAKNDSEQLHSLRNSVSETITLYKEICQ